MKIILLFFAGRSTFRFYFYFRLTDCLAGCAAAELAKIDYKQTVHNLNARPQEMTERATTEFDSLSVCDVHMTQKKVFGLLLLLLPEY